MPNDYSAPARALQPAPRQRTGWPTGVLKAGGAAGAGAVGAGGDCVSLGQDLTVQAVQHGKLAAEAMHAQLMLNVEAA